MRNIVKAAVYKAACAIGAPAILRARGAGPILCYHNVVADRAAADGDQSLHMPARTFESHVARLRATYDLVSLSDYAERLTSPNGCRGLAALTFDDAYAGVLAHAVPGLLAFQIPFTLFVVSEAPGRPTAFWWDDGWITPSLRTTHRERWLQQLQGRGDRIRSEYANGRPPGDRADDLRPATWDALAQLVVMAGATVSLGAHSATHAALDAIDDPSLRAETDGAAQTLRSRLPGPFDTFAYPYGRWNPRAREAVNQAGFRIAVSLDAGRNDRQQDRLALRRLNVPAGLSADALELWATGWRP